MYIRRADRRRALKLEPILITEFQLLLDLHLGIPLNILQVLVNTLPRWITNFFVKSALNVLVKVEFVQFFQFLFQISLFFGVCAAL